MILHPKTFGSDQARYQQAAVKSIISWLKKNLKEYLNSAGQASLGETEKYKLNQIIQNGLQSEDRITFELLFIERDILIKMILNIVKNPELEKFLNTKIQPTIIKAINDIKAKFQKRTPEQIEVTASGNKSEEGIQILIPTPEEKVRLLNIKIDNFLARLIQDVKTTKELLLHKEDRQNPNARFLQLLTNHLLYFSILYTNRHATQGDSNLRKKLIAIHQQLQDIYPETALEQNPIYKKILLFNNILLYQNALKENKSIIKIKFGAEVKDLDVARTLSEIVCFDDTRKYIDEPIVEDIIVTLFDYGNSKTQLDVIIHFIQAYIYKKANDNLLRTVLEQANTRKSQYGFFNNCNHYDYKIYKPFQIKVLSVARLLRDLMEKIYTNQLKPDLSVLGPLVTLLKNLAVLLKYQTHSLSISIPDINTAICDPGTSTFVAVFIIKGEKEITFDDKNLDRLLKPYGFDHNHKDVLFKPNEPEEPQIAEKIEDTDEPANLEEIPPDEKTPE